MDATEFRKLGQQLVELMTRALGVEHNEPVMAPTTGQEIIDLVNEDLPRHGIPAERVLALCSDPLLRFGRRNGHPRFFGYVCGSADPVAILADALATAFNQNLTAWRSSPAAVEIERLVIRWLDAMVGFAGDGHGMLVSGGSAANLQALTCAVTQAEQQASLPSGSRHRLTIYLSREGHLSMIKAARLLGLADDHIRLIEVDDDRRLRLDDLRHKIEHDLTSGLIPAAVCGSAGTSNTGTIDPLDALADLAAQHDIWFHIDGAYGAPAAMVPEYRWMARAFARADSLSLDPHKWLYSPLDSGCILYRDAAASQQAFALDSEYIAVTQTDPRESFAYFNHGAELSRRFRALKIWATIKTHGVDRLTDTIALNITLRRHLDNRVEEHPNLELLGSELSISCFRYHPPNTADNNLLNTLNRQILETLVAEGRVLMSPTTLDGRYALRVCIVNFRTRASDIDLLIDEVLRLGESFSSNA